MATWQFDVFFSPALGALSNRNLLTRGDPVDILEQMRDVTTEDLPDSSISNLVEDMRIEKSWNSDLEICGNMDGDRIDISRQAKIVSAIASRIDIREIDPQFMMQLVAFAEYNQLLLIDSSTGNVIGTNVSKSVEAIMKSPAARFVGDPNKFFRTII